MLALKWPFQWQRGGLGSKGFIEKTKAELGIGAKPRRIRRHGGAYGFQEPRLLTAMILALKTAV